MSQISYPLSYVTCTVGHLVGQFDVENTTKSSKTIDGVKTSDGKFWVPVEAQITTGTTPREWNWKPIGKLAVPGEHSTLKADPLTPENARDIPSFHVHLDIFKPFIGKATYGRIVLANGDFSMFDLNDLATRPSNLPKGALVPTSTP